jgi:hypothetical protein
VRRESEHWWQLIRKNSTKPESRKQRVAERKMINNPRHSLVHGSEVVPTIVVADDGSITIAEELRAGIMGCELRNCDRIVIRTRVKQLFSGFGDEF